MENVTRPLTGVKVVEMATFIAVPAAGRLLSDMGAQVIKIESSKGDNLRFTAPSEGRPLDQDENTSFDLENSGKKVITLDVRGPKGKEILYKLLDEADIFLTNWRPGALARQDLDYEHIKAKYPSLVYGNVTGYGEKGPDKDLPGFDYTAFFARGGWSGTLYQKGTVPGNWIPGLGDHQAAMALTAGVCAALNRAKETGIGEKVSVNLLHAAIYMQAMLIQASQYGNEFGGQVYPIDRRNNVNPILPCAKTKDDRFIQICTPVYDAYFPSLFKAIGREDLLDNPVYAHLAKANEEGRVGEIYDIYQEAMAKKTAAEWKDILTEADIPFSICQTWDEILKDPQAHALDVFSEIDYPRGKKLMVRTPVDLEDTPLPPYNKAPKIGENTDEILTMLGYDAKAIEELKVEGVVEGPKDL
ncbi:MAG: CaiB/BaiF CoA transferase family protein [Eggerthellaceae bacterium]